jgi:hypothetical protein
MDRLLTLTYRGRTFLIRPVATEDGAWTEAVSEDTGGTSDLWKGSGIDYVDTVACDGASRSRRHHSRRRRGS